MCVSVICQALRKSLFMYLIFFRVNWLSLEARIIALIIDLMDEPLSRVIEMNAPELRGRSDPSHKHRHQSSGYGEEIQVGRKKKRKI